MRLLAFAALVAALALAAVGVLLARSGGGEERTGSVTLVGDSLNVGIEPYVLTELDGWQVRNENLVGRTTDGGLGVLDEIAGRLAPVVVVSLGTNDPQEDVQGFRQDVESVLRAAGRRRCVVWSTIWRGGPNRGFNEVLREAARRYPNLEIDDWAALVTAEPELLAPDDVHGSPEGYRRRAERVAEIVRRCLPEAPTDAEATS